jgi:hypothetical protein
VAAYEGARSVLGPFAGALAFEPTVQGWQTVGEWTRQHVVHHDDYDAVRPNPLDMGASDFALAFASVVTPVEDVQCVLRCTGRGGGATLDAAVCAEDDPATKAILDPSYRVERLMNHSPCYRREDVPRNSP